MKSFLKLTVLLNQLYCPPTAYIVFARRNQSVNSLIMGLTTAIEENAMVLQQWHLGLAILCQGMYVHIQ